MNNSVFGKTMEAIENRVDIRLVGSAARAAKLVAKPSYERTTIFDKNLVAIHMKRTKLLYNKPIYLGMCILDLSKTLTYDFYYNYIKRKCGYKSKLLFTDTDSLAYEIETEDFYVIVIVIVIVNSKLLKRHSKAKRRAPAYSRALKSQISPTTARFDTNDYPKDHPSGSEVNKSLRGYQKVTGMFKRRSC